MGRLRGRWGPAGLLLGGVALGLGLWLVARSGPEAPAGPGLSPPPGARHGLDLAAPDPGLDGLARAPGPAAEARPERLRDPPTRELVQAPARRVAGRVVVPADAPQGSAATVVLRSSAGGRPIEERAPVDGAGAFSLSVPALARHATLDLEGELLYLDRPERVLLAGQSEDLRLEARLGGRLVVRLRRLDGTVPRDAVGATVRLAGRGAGRTAVVDAWGQARFPALAPGVLGPVSCEVPGYLPSRVQDPAAVEAGVTRELDLLVVQGASVAGRVVDTAGTPLAGALVGLEALVRPEGEQGPTLRLSHADENGRYLFQHVVPGRYHLAGGGTRIRLGSVTAYDERPEVWRQVTLTEGQDLVLDLRLE